MRYNDAMAGVLDAFFSTCTAFGGPKPMPDLTKLPAEEAFPVLLEHVKWMKGWGLPALHEWNLFWEEFHITRLLLLIAYVGIFTDEIPITPEDIEAAKTAFNSLISAGWREERQTIDVLKAFIAEATKARRLPSGMLVLFGS